MPNITPKATKQLQSIEINDSKRVESFSKETHNRLHSLDDNENSSSVFFDPVLIEEIEKLTNGIKNCEESIKSTNSSIRALIDQCQNEYRVSLSLVSEEMKQLLKTRNKEISEINTNVFGLQKNMNEHSVSIEIMEQKIQNLNSSVAKFNETGKIIHGLLMQDENDRESLQLSCYTEKHQQKGHNKQKMLATLKPECLSCNSQNSVVFSAFKMACLNYYPSEVNYNTKFYPRKELIMKLGDLLGTV